MPACPTTARRVPQCRCVGASVRARREDPGTALHASVPSRKRDDSTCLCQEAVARENDAAMLRKLPAGSRAFVERQRRARALQNGKALCLGLGLAPLTPEIVAASCKRVLCCILLRLSSPSCACIVSIALRASSAYPGARGRGFLRAPLPSAVHLSLQPLKERRNSVLKERRSSVLCSHPRLFSPSLLDTRRHLSAHPGEWYPVIQPL